MPDNDNEKLPVRINENIGDDRVRQPVPLPFRLRDAMALPIGWPPDVAPNQVITSTHINQIRSSVAQWPADVDGMGHWLRNVKLENVTGVMVDPTTTAGDLLVRDAGAAPVRFPIGTQGQVLTVNTAVASKLKWVTPVPVVSSVHGRTGAVVSVTGDYIAAQITNAVDKTVAYADPSWITALSWSKIFDKPAAFTPMAHTHDAADVISGRFNTARLGTGIADATVFLRGDGLWSVPAGTGGGGGDVLTVFGRIGNVTAQTGDYSAAQVSGAVVDPTIALGDLMARTNTGIARVPLGANGQVLQSDNTQPAGLKWVTVGGGSGIPSGLTNGDILQWKTGSWNVLPVGAVGQVLSVDTGGVGLKWAVGAGGSQTPWLQDIDGGNHALTNVQVMVSNGAVRSIAGGFIFPDGSTQTSAFTKAAAQTPWVQDIDAANFKLQNASFVSIKGANITGPEKITAVALIRDTDTVGDTFDVVWKHSTFAATTAYGRLEFDTAVSPASSSDFVFHARDSGGGNGYNNEILRVMGAGGIRVTGTNKTGVNIVSGLVLDRPYGDIGDAMDIVWPGAARLSVNAWAGGESAFILYAQTGAGNGEANEIMRVLGNHQIKVPQGFLEIYEGTPSPYVTSGSWPLSCINNAVGGCAVFATQDLNSAFGSSPLTAGTVNAGQGSYKEFFGVRGNGWIVMPSMPGMNYTSDAVAAAAGIPVGGIYHNAGSLRVRLT